MKLRLFPQDTAGLDLLSRTAGQLLDGTAVLAEMLGADPDGFDRLVEDMHRIEAEATDLHFALMTQMRTSFINPLPREDLYELSLLLLTAVERLDGAAEIIGLYRPAKLSRRAAEVLEVINRQSELTVAAMRRLASLQDLEEYWIEMLRLTKRAERTHRMWVAEMLQDLKPAAYARHRDLADQLASVVSGLRSTATYVGGVLVRES
ncbi:hypothetical protein BN1051_00397 [Arthrobacter saudimassiliensis]|uniref:Pit accessory protein n=1 Tax=Arthrobacter saudimassiliensis TaxID=1461584 RepID=A0A078MLE2_9MICC|nr:hypothetical protein BN1051_00397 [Arthrobacter saudimassiliensis]